MQNHKNLIDINELAEILNIKVSKVRSMVFKNEIPYIKLGRLVRFKTEEIQNWLDQLRR